MNIKKLNLKNYNNIFIYGFGLSGKWFADNSDKKIKFFIDTDEKKSGRSHNGIQVLSINEAKKIISKQDLIIVTPVDIQDVEPVLKREFKEVNWLALGVFLDGNDTKESKNYSNENLNFIQYSLNALEKCHKAYINKDKLFLRSVDIVISERCSLKCKDCSKCGLE